MKVRQRGIGETFLLMLSLMLLSSVVSAKGAEALDLTTWLARILDPGQVVDGITFKADRFVRKGGSLATSGDLRIGDHVLLTGGTVTIQKEAHKAVGSDDCLVWLLMDDGTKQRLFQGGFTLSTEMGLLQPAASFSWLLDKLGDFRTQPSPDNKPSLNVRSGEVTGLAHLAISLEERDQDAIVHFTLRPDGSVSGDFKDLKLTLAGCRASAKGARFEERGTRIALGEVRLTLPKALGGLTGEPMGGLYITAAGLGGGPANRERLDTQLPEPTGSITDCSSICQDQECTPITLPPIMVTDTLWIYPTTACLCISPSMTGCPIRLEGQGGFFLPNLNATPGITEGLGIYVRFKICTNSLRFETINPKCACLGGDFALPIGQSGFCLTHLEGCVSFGEDAVPSTIQVNGTIEPCQIPDIISATGTIIVSLEPPYPLYLRGAITVLTWEAARAAVTITQGSGVEGTGWITIPYCSGEAYLHVWREGETIHFTGNASATCEIEAGEFDGYIPHWLKWLCPSPCLPPFTIRQATECSLGEFCAECGEGQCPDPGRKYGVECCVSVPISLTIPIIGKCTITPTVCFTAASDGSRGVWTNIERCGFSQTEANTFAKIERAEAGEVHTLPLYFDGGSALWLVEWQRGAPRLRLIDPMDVVVSPQGSYPGVGYTAMTNSAIFYLQGATSGTWQLEIANLKGNEFYALRCPCTLNTAPTIYITSPSSSEVATDSYTIRWRVSDPDSDARASLYYDTDRSGYDGTLIAECLPEGMTSYVWNTSQVGAGTYYIYVRVDDGKNAPLRVYSQGSVTVRDQTPPSAPARIRTSGDGRTYLDVCWDRNPERDVVGYRVYLGPARDHYTMTLDATNVTCYRVPLRRGVNYAALSAYDSSGNEGPRAMVPFFVDLPLLLKVPPPAPTATPTATSSLTATLTATCAPTVTGTATPICPCWPTPTPTSDSDHTIVYITETGIKYHRLDCRYVRGGATPVSCSWAQANSYTPCSVCDPWCP